MDPPKKNSSPCPRLLLGPPEIRRPYKEQHCASDTQRSTHTSIERLQRRGGNIRHEADPEAGDPFMNLMNKKFNINKGLTENLSPTFLSSGDPCLDFFCQIVPGTRPEIVVSLLSGAWEKDPLKALKLVCHLRGVRGTGKSDKLGFYTAALWLHRHHPKTLALNLRSFAEFGYLKDLLVILVDLLKRRRCIKRPKLIRVTSKKAVGKEEARELRRDKKITMAERALKRYERDLKYRFFHDKVADIFAELLREDMESLKTGNINQISLAAKWCPSLDSSFDRQTLICESIACRVFPREAYPEYHDIEEEHYAYRVRDRLRKEVLVPLRRALELPEVFMGANQWNILPYNRVASVAMKNYRKLFAKHDGERFGEYLLKVETGEGKIAAGALLPHEVIATVRDQETTSPSNQVVSSIEISARVAELQWGRIVADLCEKGKLRDCIAVCDVSGSMLGTPMDVCVALGLLVSELSEEPWKGRVITFSSEPHLLQIKGRTLKEKVKFIEEMDWGYNTNFQRVFDQILRVAVEGKLPAEKMIKRLFVFSDMEFDQASECGWETDYEAIQRKFDEHGYGESIPEIVFWNLRSSSSIPVGAEQKGVALVSGFSKNMLTLFLDGNDFLSPVEIMESAISGKEFDKLVVFD